MSFLEIPDTFPHRGNGVTKFMGRGAYRLFGWKMSGHVPDIRHALVLGAPHTSTWDLPVALATVAATQFSFNWLGKHTIFEGPLGPMWQWLGGVPVNRQGNLGVVSQIVNMFEERDFLWLLISPEGTRKKTERWRTGFYYIAQEANVPIIPVALDFGTKCVHLLEPFYPTGDLEADMTFLQGLYQPDMARNPERF
ncbi:MAG TPA: 1-acyl-sn-glycerol-3-phosphate acyltransferase [Anaerolineae bacterium]|nr:1-acyl-sn-glycerol-3-phosphate acyltransferase [Anaerolineae bacterium]